MQDLDRKIRCDGAFPTCTNCLRARRTCQGYGLRLSWPHRHDRRRAIEGPEPPTHTGNRPITVNRWVNTSVLDIELYINLSDSLYMRAALSWNPSQSDATISELLRYFESVALYTLSTCEDDPRKFLGALTRLALTDAEDSSKAVLQAICAVASVHRHGLQAQSVRYQGTAIRALMSSAENGINDTQAVQHVATSMLLCSFEVQASSRKPGPWLWYVNGAKRLIHTIHPEKRTLTAEFMAMVNWVYYHDVMSQFSLRHWRVGQTADVWDFSHPLGPALCNLSQVSSSRSPSCSLSVLEPLSEVFRSLVAPSNPQFRNQSYRDRMGILEMRLDDFPANLSALSAPSDKGPIRANSDRLVSLFRLAALVYLERISNNLSGSSPKLDVWINSAFRIMTSIRACKYLFPLLIFGCEARTDAHRIIMLDTINETARKTHSLNLQSLLGLLQALWSQDDLQGMCEMDYNERLNAIISVNETIPSFA
ncbi:fungal-specific transcription factor domain-containing protein [Mariannaea sp. PMI_226]|nr:fungal-specific transcription factor domain-containing protein [Mariannaea sp. PMI_226]